MAVIDQHQLWPFGTETVDCTKLTAPMCTVGSPDASSPPLPGVPDEAVGLPGREHAARTMPPIANIVSRNIKILNRCLLIVCTSSSLSIMPFPGNVAAQALSLIQIDRYRAYRRRESLCLHVTMRLPMYILRHTIGVDATSRKSGTCPIFCRVGT